MMKRIIVFISQYYLSLFVSFNIWVILSGSAFVIFHGLMNRFMPFPRPQEHLSGMLELGMFIISTMIGACFAGITSIEKMNRTAELLFATPLPVKEYMFSLWVCLLFSCMIITPVLMGVFVLIAGVERLANVSPLIWAQILPVAITFVSAGGVLARILLIKNFLKKVLYSSIFFFLPFLAFLLLTVAAMIQAYGAIGPGFLPSWVLKFLTYRAWLYWLPGVIYTLCFFLMIRKIEVRSFFLP